MWVSEINIKKIRGFVDLSLKLSSGINVITGKNNSGKSTILKSIYFLQESKISGSDIRLTESKAEVNIEISDLDRTLFSIKNNLNKETKTPLKVNFRLERPNSISAYFREIGPNRIRNVIYNNFNQRFPDNFICPYFSNRKVNSYSQEINKKSSNLVSENFTFLYSKISKLSNPNIPSFKKFDTACREIVGFPISCMQTDGGQEAGIPINDNEYIPLSAMGDGIPNLVALIADLCLVKGKLFIIEELENDIHPEALKKLLDFIIDNSNSNQFIISTHSNIVVKQLGAVESSYLFNVSSITDENNLPFSEVEFVADAESRSNLLEGLGYAFSDFNMWDGWLFFEESSIERFVKDFFIAWFAPELNNKLKTFSCNGLSKVKNKFEYFNTLMVFLHLESIYKNRAWVFIDYGDDELKVLKALKKIYVDKHNWSEDRFIQLSKHDFEKYYPERFQVEVEEILAVKDKQIKRNRKKELLEKVVSWSKQDSLLAKKEFEISASEIIQLLKKIELESNDWL